MSAFKGRTISYEAKVLAGHLDDIVTLAQTGTDLPMVLSLVGSVAERLRMLSNDAKEEE